MNYYQRADEHSKLRAVRAAAVSRNRSRRARGLSTEPLPELPAAPRKLVAYDGDGEWQGIIPSGDVDDCPDGYHCRWER